MMEVGDMNQGGDTTEMDNGGGDGSSNNYNNSDGSSNNKIPRSLITTPNPLPRAAELLFASNQEEKLYWDRSHYQSPEAQMEALAKSSTLYIGNLAFSTRARHIRSHFSAVGPVKEIHVGLDRFQKTPCGFCFVEYYHRQDALLAVANLSGTKLDGRVIRVELDAGFQQGRQYGRGLSGGQLRDDLRNTSDPARRNRNAASNTNNSNNNRRVGGRLNWTPPDQVRAEQEGNNSQNNDNTGSDNYFGPAGDLDNSKRDDGDTDMDRPDKNPRFRED